MGNNTSSDGSTVPRPVRPFSRSGALGLSKSELEKRSQPSGLYPSCKWEEKAVRRLIGDGRLAARLRGTECRVSPFDRECPICFLHYSQVNVTLCCKAHVCTECYLQVRPQKERSSACPFCNNSKLQVAVAQKMGIDDIQEREEEEQRVIAATIRARAQDDPESGVPSSEGSESSSSTFGASLQQIMRARSESLGETSEQTDSEQLASLALTPAERDALEQEMRAQHSHPLARLVEAEAEERRLQNEREYYRTQSGRISERYSSELLRFGLGSAVSGMSAESVHRGILSRLESDPSVPTGLSSQQSGPRRARDWNQIVDAFESGGHGEVHSLDDLVVLEAAILLSMEEESRRNQLEGRAGRSSFDAASHAREGFPLVQQFLNSRSASEEEGAGGGEDDALHNSIRALGRPVRRRSSLLQGRLRRLSASNSLSARSMSEEEQLALAIAASLREFGTQPAGTSDAEGQDEQQVATPPAGDGIFYGKPVAVGIAAADGSAALPAVGIMVDDEDSGIMADDGVTDHPASGEMTEDGSMPRFAVGDQAKDSPIASPSERESPRAHLQSASADVVSAEKVEPVTKQTCVRSIASGDAVATATMADVDDDEEDDQEDQSVNSEIEDGKGSHNQNSGCEEEKANDATESVSVVPSTTSDHVTETNEIVPDSVTKKDETGGAAGDIVCDSEGNTSSAADLHESGSSPIESVSVPTGEDVSG